MLEFNSMKPVIINSGRKRSSNQHTWNHWIFVIFIRVIKFIVFAPVGCYLIAIGYSVSKQTISNFLPTWTLNNIDNFFSLLPSFQEISAFALQRVLFWAKDIPDWRTVVLGMPSILIGMVIFLTVLFDLLMALFDPHFQKTHCPVCQK